LVWVFEELETGDLKEKWRKVLFQYLN
jgi:hypothetical protein